VIADAFVVQCCIKCRSVELIRFHGHQ
jgi:hypothetical protein